jgi:hypothetical protein
VSSELEAALLRCLSRDSKPQLVQLDLEAKLHEAGLSQFFPPDTWPSSKAVRELATQVKQLRKGLDAERAAPFVAVELKKLALHLSCAIVCFPR